MPTTRSKKVSTSATPTTSTRTRSSSTTTRGKRKVKDEPEAVTQKENVEVNGAASQHQVKRIKIQGILEDFDEKVEFKCKRLRSQAEETCISINSALQVMLMKLPTKIKNMRMCDLLAPPTYSDTNTVQATPLIARTTRKATANTITQSSNASGEFKTPATRSRPVTTTTTTTKLTSISTSTVQQSNTAMSELDLLALLPALSNLPKDELKAKLQTLQSQINMLHEQMR